MSEIVCSYLASGGYRPTAAYTAAAAYGSFTANAYDLAIIDVNLPDRSGFDLADSLRLRRDCAIIFMTTLASSESRLRGLEEGDDYIVKPVDVRELLARVRAVLRRYRHSRPLRLPVVEFGGWTLDLVRRELSAPGGVVNLTRGEFDLLAALVQFGDTPVDRDYLVEVVASAEVDSRVRTVDVMVSRIRRKLAASGPAAPRIITKKGVGYSFAAPGS